MRQGEKVLTSSLFLLSTSPIGRKASHCEFSQLHAQPFDPRFPQTSFSQVQANLVYKEGSKNLKGTKQTKP